MTGRSCKNCGVELEKRQKTFCSHRCDFKYRWNTRYGPRENSPNWRGGKTTISRGIRATYEYRKWRRAVLTRDENRCVLCGANLRLHVDHVKPIVTHPELIFDLDNGRTLCFNCHRSTPSWGRNPPNASTGELAALLHNLDGKKRKSKLLNVVELNAAGCCASEISRRLGIGRSSVVRYIKMAGLVNASGCDKRKRANGGGWELTERWKSLRERRAAA